jgi:hypothetical protein
MVLKRAISLARKSSIIRRLLDHEVGEITIEARVLDKEAKSPPGKSKEVEKLKETGMPEEEAFGIAWKQYNKEHGKKTSSTQSTLYIELYNSLFEDFVDNYDSDEENWTEIIYGGEYNQDTEDILKQITKAGLNSNELLGKAIKEVLRNAKRGSMRRHSMPEEELKSTMIRLHEEKLEEYLAFHYTKPQPVQHELVQDGDGGIVMSQIFDKEGGVTLFATEHNLETGEVIEEDENEDAYSSLKTKSAIPEGTQKKMELLNGLPLLDKLVRSGDFRQTLAGFTYWPNLWKGSPTNLLDERSAKDLLLDLHQYIAVQATPQEIDKIYYALDTYINQARQVSASLKFATDVSDEVEPLQWTTEADPNDPKRQPVQPNQGIQQPVDQSAQEPSNHGQSQPGGNVLYDSKKDAGPQIQTTVNPKSKEVTIKFMDSPQQQNLDQNLDQGTATAPGQPSTPNQTPEGVQGPEDQYQKVGLPGAPQMPGTQQGFDESEIPVQF